MKRTNIEWTDFSSNPIQYRDAAGKVVWACVKKSAGCANCYSEAIAERFDRGGPFTREVTAGLTPFLDDKELKHILSAQQVGGKNAAGSRCFLGDMTDVFGEWVPDSLLDRLFAAIAMRPDVTFQVLTKRADRMAAYFRTADRRRLIAEQVMPLSNMLAAAARSHTARLKMSEFEAVFLTPGPFRNLWLGASVENQAAADERIPHLLDTPAAVRFLSCEPLLSRVDLKQWLWAFDENASRDIGAMIDTPCRELHWVIVGCESGVRRRPMDQAWVASLVGQCRAAGVDCFVKQMEVKSRVCGDQQEFPQDLRVRAYPSTPSEL